MIQLSLGVIYSTILKFEGFVEEIGTVSKKLAND